VGVQSVSADSRNASFYEANVRDLFKKGKWEEGKKLLDEGMENYGSLSFMNEFQGKYYYQKKDYNKARYYLNRALKEDRSNNVAREMLLNVEEETQHYSSALCYVNEMLEYSPYAKNLWLRKVDLLRKLNNDKEAEVVLTRLRQIYPDDQTVKRNVDYQNEERLANMKRLGDIEGQIKALTDLVKSQPKNTEYYIQLINVLHSNGDDDAALEMVNKGVKSTGDYELIKKKVGMLTEKGRYAEAIAFINDCKVSDSSMRPQLNKLQNDVENEAAVGAQTNDAYAMYSKMYSRTKNQEALNYLLNTSISRGYYEDALNYIRESKKKKGESEALLYKTYIVNSRIGNTKEANSALKKLVARYPKNTDAMASLCDLYFKNAKSTMADGQFDEALPLLQFVSMNSKELDQRMAANSRMYTCNMELKDYNSAMEILEQLREYFGEERYAINKASILHEKQKDSEALQLIAATMSETSDSTSLPLLSNAYEEIAQPFIKKLLNIGSARQALEEARRATEICPKSSDIMRQAISAAALLHKDEDYKDLVMTARKRFPNDPFFVVKEASIYANEAMYDTARKIVYPLLENYAYDSTIVNAHSDFCQMQATKLYKKLEYEPALGIVDTALLYAFDKSELFYTKGLILEKMHMYDSAYYYQKDYVPSPTEINAFNAHLEDLQNKAFKNHFMADYQRSINTNNNTYTANAIFEYSRRIRENNLSFSMGYTGRNGVDQEDLDSKKLITEEESAGGAAIQFGIGWQQRLGNRTVMDLSATWGSRFFPRLTFKMNFAVSLRNDWSLDFRGSYRSVGTYDPHVVSLPDLSLDYTNKQDTVYYTKLQGWEENKMNIFIIGSTLSKTVKQFLLALGADAYLYKKSLYYSSNFKMTFFPVEGATSNVFLATGVGSAPEATLLDKRLPATFDNINTFVGAGGKYVLNRSLTFGLSGTWYSFFVQNTYLVDNKSYNTYCRTVYTNYFYVNAQLYISF
jgi:tetratricopeptide (TPR) repeat protein